MSPLLRAHSVEPRRQGFRTQPYHRKAEKIAAGTGASAGRRSRSFILTACPTKPEPNATLFRARWRQAQGTPRYLPEVSNDTILRLPSAANSATTALRLLPFLRRAFHRSLPQFISPSPATTRVRSPGPSRPITARAKWISCFTQSHNAAGWRRSGERSSTSWLPMAKFRFARSVLSLIAAADLKRWVERLPAADPPKQAS